MAGANQAGAAHADEGQDVLPAGVSLLFGQYLIEGFLERGGFGATYLARDSLEREVVIKECFPATIACRVGDAVHPVSSTQGRRYRSIINHFLREARRLATLDHPNIVHVHQVFEENNTAYLAMDYVQGADLITVAETEPDRLTPDLIRTCLIRVLEAVCHIHERGMLHRDISPDNILLGPDDHVTLIDFGAAREQVGRESRMLTVLHAVKDGYSPHEFYQGDESESASSDLYSIGATFHHLLTGAPPPHSQTRIAALAGGRPDPYLPLAGRVPGFEDAFLAGIDRALCVLPQDRMTSASEWLEALTGVVSRPAPPVATPSHRIEADIRRSISRLVAESRELTRPAVPGQSGDAAASSAGVPAAKGRVAETVDPVRPDPVPVDLFGDPIEDVEAWLQAQEELIQARALQDSAPEPQEATPLARKEGLLARSLSVLRRSRGADAAPLRKT